MKRNHLQIGDYPPEEAAILRRIGNLRPKIQRWLKLEQDTKDLVLDLQSAYEDLILYRRANGILNLSTWLAAKRAEINPEILGEQPRRIIPARAPAKSQTTKIQPSRKPDAVERNTEMERAEKMRRVNQMRQATAARIASILERRNLA